MSTWQGDGHVEAYLDLMVHSEPDMYDYLSYGERGPS